MELDKLEPALLEDMGLKAMCLPRGAHLQAKTWPMPKDYHCRKQNLEACSFEGLEA